MSPVDQAKSRANTRQVPGATAEAARPGLLTAAEASAYLTVGPRFIRRIISERRVPVVRLGRHVRIAQSDLDDFVATNRTPASEYAAFPSHRLVVGGR